MNTVKQKIEQKGKDIISIFFTAGYPNLGDTTKVIAQLSASNVDFIEVGLPYSDPLADGTTIQNSSAVALKNGMNLDVLFEQLETIKETNQTPLVLMGYINQIIKYGEKKFCKKVRNCGIDTLIIPDLPMIAYENHYKKLFEAYGLSNVFLITPHTSSERIRKIDAYTTSFIYMVASANITGVGGEITQEQLAYFERIEAMNLKSKRMIGFGISNAETFLEACKYANGAIIGSAFIKNLQQKGTTQIKKFIESIKNQNHEVSS